jgi:hypothetical protein
VLAGIDYKDMHGNASSQMLLAREIAPISQMNK